MSRASRSWWALVLLAACFEPSLGDDPFLCGTSAPVCPPGYACVAGVCRNGVAPPVDARTADAPSVDAPPADGAMPPDGAVCAEQGQFIACRDATSAFVCDAQLTIALRACPSGCDATSELCKQCDPGTTGCTDDMLVTCTDKGEVESSVSCPAGCNENGGACFALQASNFAAACDVQPSARPPLLVTGVHTINTALDCDAIAGQGAAAPELCIVRYSSITVEPGAELLVRGARAGMIVAVDSMRIRGRVDASGRGRIGGPGASIVRTLGRGGSAGENTSQGGGGAGHRGPGGSGGAAAGSDVVHLGGVGYGGAALVPLLPGGFGGGGGYPCLLGGCVRNFGGGGGGALQLVACGTLELADTAVIEAGGGGGRGGAAATVATTAGGGDGGGGGGGILIEAPVIEIPKGAAVCANGGGGGGGGSRDQNAPGLDGEDGPASARAAMGGPSANDSGAGGAGAFLEGPGNGDKGFAGGGGGGAAGFIRFNARPDRPVTVAEGSVVSPLPTTGAVNRK